MNGRITNYENEQEQIGCEGCGRPAILIINFDCSELDYNVEGDLILKVADRESQSVLCRLHAPTWATAMIGVKEWEQA